MKISELTNEQIKEFCGFDDDVTLIEAYKTAAKQFIIGFTSLTDKELEEHEDLTLAYLVLINDMSYNRDYTVSRDTLNPTVSTLLSLYSKNYLG